MGVEKIEVVPEYTDEERRVRRRHLAQQAITLAVQSRWEEAAETNAQIVTLMPDDAEAYNRLGKAYTELGQIGDARSAYEHALETDPANLIAQRNLERLSKISDLGAAEIRKTAGQKLDPRFFMEETGKTGHVTLLEPADATTLARLTAGDEVKLQESNRQLTVVAMDGTYVGKVEPRLATRLLRLIQRGNEYQAGVVGVDNTTVRVIIRETHQAPENVGRISFPPQGTADNVPRPYLREGLIRRGGDDEDEDDSDVELDQDADEEEEDSSEFGFHEGPLEES
jgi:tetratricopeptide (TPR) repeat protein